MDGMPHEPGVAHDDGDHTAPCCGYSTISCRTCSTHRVHCQAYGGMLYICEICDSEAFLEISEEAYRERYGILGNYLDEEDTLENAVPTTAAHDMSKNHLPPELAAQLLEREGSLAPPVIHPAVRELLEVFAEELAETIQRVTKVLRFGFRENPWNGKHNRTTLELEFGDVLALGKLLIDAGAMRGDVVIANMRGKMIAFGKRDGRLRSAVVDESGNLVGAPLVVIE